MLCGGMRSPSAFLVCFFYISYEAILDTEQKDDRELYCIHINMAKRKRDASVS